MLIVNIFIIAPLSRLHYCAVIIVESAKPEYREMLAFHVQSEVSKEHWTAVTLTRMYFLGDLTVFCSSYTKVRVVALWEPLCNGQLLSHNVLKSFNKIIFE